MTALTQEHVLFDLDGTLVDTRDAVAECYRRVFRQQLGRNFPPPSLEIGELFAMRPHELFARIEPERVEDLYQAYQDTYPACIDRVRVFAGVAEMIEALVAAGRKPSLVTNKGRARTRIDLGVAGVAPERFAAIVTAEDTVERKPHPAPLLLGLARAGATAGEALYVGDGPQDVLAAQAAGMPAIAVTYGFYERSALEGLGPDAIVASVAELCAALGVDPVRRKAAS